MIQKKQVETLLKVNGLDLASPDDEIRSVLLSAYYNEDEIDTTLMILRENKTTNDRHIDGLHKVFRTNQGLTPEEIHSFLGIEVNLDDSIQARTAKKADTAWLRSLVFVLTTIISAIAGLFFAMYHYNIGIFYSS